MDKKILVYGAGAVGLGILSCFFNEKIYPDIIVRKDTKDIIKKNGIKREGIFGEYFYSPEFINVYSDIKDCTNKIYDYIFICVKSTDTEKTAEKIYNVYGNREETKFILFQNGWGNAEIFSKYFYKENIYNARVITGFCRPEKNIVKITVHSDEIKIGSIFNQNLKEIECICSIIKNGGIPCSISGNISKDLWAKLLYNSALNPLGALFRVTYGELVQNIHTKKIIENIIKEIFYVMKISGYETYWENYEEYINDFYERIVPPTYKHESSMLQDIRSGKSTEIDFLNGAVLKIADEFNIKISVNEMIVNMVKFISNKDLTKE